MHQSYNFFKQFYLHIQYIPGIFRGLAVLQSMYKLQQLYTRLYTIFANDHIPISQLYIILDTIYTILLKCFVSCTKTHFIIICFISQTRKEWETKTIMPWKEERLEQGRINSSLSHFAQKTSINNILCSLPYRLSIAKYCPIVGFNTFLKASRVMVFFNFKWNAIPNKWLHIAYRLFISFVIRKGNYHLLLVTSGSVIIAWTQFKCVISFNQFENDVFQENNT